MSWQTFRIVDSIQANRVSPEFMEGLFAAFSLHGAFKDVGIFSYLNLEDGSTDYYFTPRAAEIAASLAKRYNAKPCSAPPLIEGMSLLAGDQRSRDLLAGPAVVAVDRRRRGRSGSRPQGCFRMVQPDPTAIPSSR